MALHYLTLDELNAKVPKQERYGYIVENGIADHKKVSDFYPCKLLFKCSEYDGKYHLELYTIYLDSAISISIHYSGQYKKWFVNANYSQYKELTINECNKIKDTIAAPNYIGVLTTNKIQAWVTYWEHVDKLWQAANNDGQKHVNEFLKSVEGLPIRWNHNKTSGSIIKSGLELEFSINPGHVSKTIKVHYSVDNTVNNFIALSSNKFTDNK